MNRCNFFFLMICSYIFLPSMSGEKYGLIIALGDYPETSGWPDISSQNDVIHVNDALLALGFNSQNISILTDSKATKDGIITSIKMLTDKLKPGDFVYIHFSGHGQQIMDDNGDEIDQLDEAIVPYDSPIKFQKGIYEGQKLIRDDLIGELTDKIRSKCGVNGQLILVLDSCHSGTGVRGLGNVRGTATIMAPETFVASQSTESKISISKKKVNNVAPMACFFGASAKELNYETLDNQSRPVGSLTFALCSVLANMKTGYTFEDLFERVKLKMKVLAPRQNPQWEGPENVTVFGGTVNALNDFYKIIETNGNIIKATVGTLSDVFEGSTIEVYSKDKNKVVSMGEVTTALLSSSIITLTTPINNSDNDLYVVKVISKAYPSLRIGMSSRVDAKSVWAKISQELMALPLINAVNTGAELYLSDCGEDHSLQLATNDGTILFEKVYHKTNTASIKKEIEITLRSYAQGNFLRSYENISSPYDFALELIAVDCKTGKTLPLNRGSEAEVKVGSCAKFKVSNNGISGAYFSLIDIQPDNGLNIVVPAMNTGYTPEEYYLKAGESYTTDYLEIGEPLGNEAIKLITSKTAQDLSGIICNQGRSKRGIDNLDPFEKMLASTYTATNTRGVKVKRTTEEEVGTKTIYFKIIN